MNLNINKDDSTLNDYISCWESFGNRPNKIIIHNSYDTKLFSEKLINFPTENNLTEIIPDIEKVIVNNRTLLKINEEIYLSYLTLDSESESSLTSELVFFYKKEENLTDIEKIIDNLVEAEVNEDNIKEVKNNIYSIHLNNNELYIENINFNSNIDMVDLYYSNKTFKKINKTIKNIKNAKKGITILFGDFGTGKTSSINYISSKIEKDFIYIPNNMIDISINNPSFSNLLRKYKNSVLFIDDSEFLNNDIINRNNTLNNIIQLVDSYLSDDININIILIFNILDKEEIDESLLECNNLLDIIDFEYLSSKESTELSKHLKFNFEYKNKTKLSNVLKNKKHDKIKKIGF